MGEKFRQFKVTLHIKVALQGADTLVHIYVYLHIRAICPCLQVLRVTKQKLNGVVNITFTEINRPEMERRCELGGELTKNETALNALH